MTRPGKYYFHIVVVGLGLQVKFFTDVAPPRVGELVSLNYITNLRGYRKVLEVKHEYFIERREETIYFDEVQILLEQDESAGIH